MKRPSWDGKRVRSATHTEEEQVVVGGGGMGSREDLQIEGRGERRGRTPAELKRKYSFAAPPSSKRYGGRDVGPFGWEAKRERAIGGHPVGGEEARAVLSTCVYSLPW